MTKKNVIGRFLVIFLICLVVFAGIKSFKERKEKQKDVASTSVQTTSYGNETSGTESNKPAANETKPEVVETKVVETKEPTIDKQDIEDRIEAYLQEEKVAKARSLYEQYEDLGLKGSLLKDINTMEMDLVVDATEEAKAVYFENNDIAAAKEIIATCEKKVGTNNETLNEYKQILDSCKEVKMTTLDYVDCGTSPKVKSSFQDGLGNSYTDGFYMDADPYAFDGVFGTYYVANLGVNTFKATIAPGNHMTVSEGHPYKIRIKTKDADQNVTTVYESPAITVTTLPFDINVDIGDAPFVIVSCTRGSDISGPLGGAYIANPVLFNKLTEDDFDIFW